MFKLSEFRKLYTNAEVQGIIMYLDLSKAEVTNDNFELFE